MQISHGRRGQFPVSRFTSYVSRCLLTPSADLLHWSCAVTRPATMTEKSEQLFLLAAVVSLLVLSGIGPRDRLTWMLEVTPVLIALPVIAATYASFPLTPLVYRLIALHAAILMLGGHYTYAEVPAGYWVRDLLGLARNHYDRLGHFAQGFVPAIIAREILLRRTPLRPG